MHKGNPTRWKLVCQFIQKEVLLILKLVVRCVSNDFQSKAFLYRHLNFFRNSGLIYKLYVLKTMRHGIKMHCPECTQAHIHPCCKGFGSLTLEKYAWTSTQHSMKKKKGGWGWGGEGQGDKITALKSVRHLKRFSTESRWNLWSSCFITHSDPCTAHNTTFYILPYAQLTNWYDKNRVCFTTYIFSLHSKILQQKSAGSCDKKKKNKPPRFKRRLILWTVVVDWEGSTQLAKKHGNAYSYAKNLWKRICHN